MTAILAATGELVRVERISKDDYKVTFQSGSTAFMPEKENGKLYLILLRSQPCLTA